MYIRKNIDKLCMPFFVLNPAYTYTINCTICTIMKSCKTKFNFDDRAYGAVYGAVS